MRMQPNAVCSLSRRLLLRSAIVMSALGLTPSVVKAQACQDASTLPASQRSLRAALGFRPESDDPKRRCGGCAFYAASEGSCGKCALLRGGMVPAVGRCDSWAARK